MRSDAGFWMLDAGENKKILILSSISPRRRLYEPEARNQYPVSRGNLLESWTFLKLDKKFKILAYIDT